MRVRCPMPPPQSLRPFRPPRRFPRREPAALARLREAVRARERGRGEGGVLALGAGAIDGHLPGGGLARAALHELSGEAGAVTGFAAALAGRLVRERGGLVLWCQGRALDAGALHGAGLVRFGLDPACVLLVTAARADSLLWAMEEGLRSREIAVVVGEARAVSLTASRRLQLAAEAGAHPALLLGPPAEPTPSAAATRWRLAAAPGAAAEAHALGPARWRLELFRCRGGMPGAWLVEWRDETRDLAVVAGLRDRADPAPAARPASLFA